MFYFSAYGLRLRSDSNLPGLTPQPSFDSPDVSLHLGRMPSGPEAWSVSSAEIWYESPTKAESGEPILRVWRAAPRQAFRFRYADSTEFLVDTRNRAIWAAWPDSLTLEDTTTYLLSSILGFFLRLRGVICLHASAVTSGNQAIAMVGPAGVGKSTTAAALVRGGLAALSDDIVALEPREGGFWIQPGYPRLNLWPESVQALYGSPERLPLITPGWDKRYLDLTQPPHTFQRQPCPLAVVYLLQEISGGDGRPRAEASAGPVALMALVANTYANYLLDVAMRAREFEFLGRLVARVPVRSVSFSHQPESFTRLPDAIRLDFEALQSARR